MGSAAEKTEYLHQPKAAPALNIPHGTSVKVHAINTTSALQVPLGAFMSPVQPGHEILKAPAFSFLVEQVSSRRKILFDLGCRKDWQKFSPAVLSVVTQENWNIEVEKNVAEILQENGVDVAGGAIEGVVWSHWHYDHIGDPSTFPGSTALIVGHGLKEALLPPYPENENSPLLETDFAGRDLKIIDFDNQPTVQIGRFRAVDYFNDGSFYLLDAPGHAIGHMCGLARVTSTQDGDSEDTFIFMGGDAAHHGAEFRPTEYLPLPKSIAPTPYAAKYPSVCPGHIFEAIHPLKKGTEPYYHISDGIPFNTEQARETCGFMQEFDAAENVFVMIAHDGSLLDERVGIEWFPRGTLRSWKKNDCSRKARWGFLKDLTKAVEQAS